MAELILAIDAGTTSVRAAVFTPTGEIAGIASAAIASSWPGPGRVEQDAGRIWRACRGTIRRALAKRTGRSAMWARWG
jgi:glycerol kinase